MEPNTITMFKQSVQVIDLHIAVKPLCSFFGLDYSNQLEKIKKDQVLNQLYGNFRTTGADSKQYQMFCLTKRGFIRWIDRINPQNVDAHLREKFIQFQVLVDEYLYGNELDSEKMRVDYARLKKLRRLYAKIGREIQHCDANVKEYLDQRFQYKIEFQEPKLLQYLS